MQPAIPQPVPSPDKCRGTPKTGDNIMNKLIQLNGKTITWLTRGCKYPGFGRGAGVGYALDAAGRRRYAAYTESCQPHWTSRARAMKIAAAIADGAWTGAETLRAAYGIE
jgi:hypothetical protein